MQKPSLVIPLVAQQVSLPPGITPGVFMVYAYNVTRSLSEVQTAFTEEQLASGPVTVSNLRASEVYTFTVQRLDSAGQPLGDSKEVTVTTPPDLTASEANLPSGISVSFTFVP